MKTLNLILLLTLVCLTLSGLAAAEVLRRSETQL